MIFCALSVSVLKRLGVVRGAIFRLPACLAVAALFAPWGALIAAQNSYPFSVESVAANGGHRVVARNLGPSAVSVRVSLVQSIDTATDRPFPVFAVVPPNGGVLHLAELRPAVPGMGSSFRFESSWLLGDFNARQSQDAMYRLPFNDGETFRIGQSPGGPITTHTDGQSANAVDIGMPQGAPVVAARDGVVIHVEAGQIYGAKTPEMLSKANEVRIRHLDGTIASYAHLAFGGVYVYPGQRVSAGDLIGLAGSTGYSSGPHLHFAVQTVERFGDELKLVSLPFRFYVGNPPVAFPPRYGLLATASYSGPAQAPQTEQATLAARHQVPAGPTGVTISFAVPAPIKQFVAGIPVWQWIVGSGVLLLLVAFFGRNRSNGLCRTRIEPAFSGNGSAYRTLLSACGGNELQASRLIRYEFSLEAGLDHEEAASRALYRLRRDMK